jgi:hypothetical protein
MPAPQLFLNKYKDDFKEAMEAGRLKGQVNRGGSIPTNNLAEGGLNMVGQGLNVMQQRIDNPLLNMVTGQPLSFKDESGNVSIGPSDMNQSLVFQAQQSKPGGWGGAIDLFNRDVSLNKGMFDLSAGLGPTNMPDAYVRLGFDTRRMNPPEIVPQQTESLQGEGLSNRYSPVVYQDPYKGRQPSPAELERDQIISQYKASDPSWYRVGTGVR